MTKFIAILFLATPLFGQGLMPPTRPINTNAQPQSLELSWTPATGAAITVIYEATNGISNPTFIATNDFTGSEGAITYDTLPIYLFVQSLASNGLASAIVFGTNFDGWGSGTVDFLQKSPDAFHWQTIYSETNGNTGNGFYRMGITKIIYPLP